MVQTKIWQMTIFQNLILFTNHYGNLQEMLEMASFLKYVDLYLTSVWGRFYMGYLYFLSHYMNLIHYDIQKFYLSGIFVVMMCRYAILDSGIHPWTDTWT
jgi:hypothetical protein